MATVHIFSIHDRNGPVLGFDLRDVLRALGPLLPGSDWFVEIEEATGDVAEVRPGRWLSSAELLDLADGLAQTRDGVAVAFPTSVGRRAGAEDLSLEAFPVSRAELAIAAVDSSWFEVYAKDPAVANLLRHRFTDVREEDARDYFPAAVTEGR